MKLFSRRILPVVFVVALIATAAFAKETTMKEDVKGAAHSIKRDWKKGWQATKKEVKKIGKGAAAATEKTAKKVKDKLD